LKTAALFEAPIACALVLAGVPDDDRPPWLACGRELGLLFQVVDDILDGDGFVVELGPEGARALADERASRAQALLAELGADTTVLATIVDLLATRTV
jgi:geranylgeranyl diphosphate synthase, type II